MNDETSVFPGKNSFYKCQGKVIKMLLELILLTPTLIFITGVSNKIIWDRLVVFVLQVYTATGPDYFLKHEPTGPPHSELQSNVNRLKLLQWVTGYFLKKNSPLERSHVRVKFILIREVVSWWSAVIYFLLCRSLSLQFVFCFISQKARWSPLRMGYGLVSIYCELYMTTAKSARCRSQSPPPPINW